VTSDVYMKVSHAKEYDVIVENHFRLISLVIWLYLTLAHVTSVFSLPVSNTILDLIILEFIF
jgi:hypothetical protein